MFRRRKGTLAVAVLAAALILTLMMVNYRGIRLGSGALASPAHRIYAGLNLKF